MDSENVALGRPCPKRTWLAMPGLTILCNVGHWGRAAAIAAALALGACASPGGDGAPATADTAATPAVRPAYGSYLAARFAGSVQDTRAAADFYISALKSDPDNIGLLRRAFALTVQDSRFDEAVPLARALVEKSSTATIANLLLVLEDIRKGRHESARERLDAAPEAGINALFGPVVRAWTLAGEGRTDDAIAALAPLNEEQSFHPFRDYHMALILENAGRDRMAEDAYVSALGDGTGSIRIVLAYGRLLERLGRAGDAGLLYREYLERYPENPLIRSAADRAARGEVPERLVGSPAEGVAEALFGTAHALSRENARPAATIYLRLALFQRPDFSDGYLLLGSLLEDTGQYENSLRVYGKVKDDSPLAWGVKLQMATLVNRLERPDEAISILEELVASKPDDIRAVTILADVLRERERYDEARQRYDRAISLIPEIDERYWVLFYTRGIAHERTKFWDAAEADFLKALELEPEQPLVLNYLGYSWIEMGRNIERARSMIERAVELRPNDGYIVDSLGWAMYRLGEFDQATETLERAVLLRPEDSTINDHLGDALWQVGRLREARFQWRHALALGAADELVAAIEAKLDDGPVTAANERP